MAYQSVNRLLSTQCSHAWREQNLPLSVASPSVVESGTQTPGNINAFWVVETTDCPHRFLIETGLRVARETIRTVETVPPCGHEPVKLPWFCVPIQRVFRGQEQPKKLAGVQSNRNGIKASSDLNKFG